MHFDEETNVNRNSETSDLKMLENEGSDVLVKNCNSSLEESNTYDLYEDFVNPNQLVDHKKINEENALLKLEIKTLTNELQEVNTQHGKLSKTNASLCKNISTLYKTAKLEIERKDATIAELRQRYDSMIFRRKQRHNGNRLADENLTEPNYVKESNTNHQRKAEEEKVLNGRSIRECDKVEDSILLKYSNVKFSKKRSFKAGQSFDDKSNDNSNDFKRLKTDTPCLTVDEEMSLLDLKSGVCSEKLPLVNVENDDTFQNKVSAKNSDHNRSSSEVKSTLNKDSSLNHSSSGARREKDSIDTSKTSYLKRKASNNEDCYRKISPRKIVCEKPENAREKEGNSKRRLSENHISSRKDFFSSIPNKNSEKGIVQSQNDRFGSEVAINSCKDRCSPSNNAFSEEKLTRDSQTAKKSSKLDRRERNSILSRKSKNVCKKKEISKSENNIKNRKNSAGNVRTQTCEKSNAQSQKVERIHRLDSELVNVDKNSSNIGHTASGEEKISTSSKNVKPATKSDRNQSSRQIPSKKLKNSCQKDQTLKVGFSENHIKDGKNTIRTVSNQTVEKNIDNFDSNCDDSLPGKVAASSCSTKKVSETKDLAGSEQSGDIPDKKSGIIESPLPRNIDKEPISGSSEELFRTGKVRDCTRDLSVNKNVLDRDVSASGVNPTKIVSTNSSNEIACKESDGFEREVSENHAVNRKGISSTYQSNAQPQKPVTTIDSKSEVVRDSRYDNCHLNRSNLVSSIEKSIITTKNTSLTKRTSKTEGYRKNDPSREVPVKKPEKRLSNCGIQNKTSDRIKAAHHNDVSASTSCADDARRNECSSNQDRPASSEEKSIVTTSTTNVPHYKKASKVREEEKTNRETKSKKAVIDKVRAPEDCHSEKVASQSEKNNANSRKLGSGKNQTKKTEDLTPGRTSKTGKTSSETINKTSQKEGVTKKCGGSISNRCPRSAERTESSKVEERAGSKSFHLKESEGSRQRNSRDVSKKRDYDEQSLSKSRGSSDRAKERCNSKSARRSSDRDSSRKTSDDYKDQNRPKSRGRSSDKTEERFRSRKISGDYDKRNWSKSKGSSDKAEGRYNCKSSPKSLDQDNSRKISGDCEDRYQSKSRGRLSNSAEERYSSTSNPRLSDRKNCRKTSNNYEDQNQSKSKETSDRAEERYSSKFSQRSSDPDNSSKTSSDYENRSKSRGGLSDKAEERYSSKSSLRSSSQVNSRKSSGDYDDQNRSKSSEELSDAKMSRYTRRDDDRLSSDHHRCSDKNIKSHPTSNDGLKHSNKKPNNEADHINVRESSPDTRKLNRIEQSPEKRTGTSIVRDMLDLEDGELDYSVDD